MGWGTVPAAATWHHLVITFDGTTVRTFADGLQTNSSTTGGYNLYTVKADGVTPLPIVIGGQNNNASPFNPLVFNSGLNIAKVKVHDAVLTPDQVFTSFAADAVTFNKATAIPPKIVSFTANPSSFMAGQPITLAFETNVAQSIAISDGASTIFTASGTAAGKGTTVVSVPGATGVTYTLTATNANGSVNAAVSVAPSVALSLVHRWSFNEPNAGGAADTNCVDSVGAAHGLSTGPQNATIRGTYNATVGTASAWTRSTDVGLAAGTQAVRLGGGASGSSAYIDLPNNVMSGLTVVTFEGWMTLNGTQTWSRYFDLGINTAGEQTAPGGSFSGTEYMLISAQVGGTATQRRISMRDNNAEQLFDAADSVTYGTQFHFAGVYDPVGNAGTSPAFKYYKNGTLVGALNTSFRPQDIAYVNNWLGRSNWSGDANTNGTYNEFRIWGLTMTPAMISASIAAGPDGTPPAVPLGITALTAFPAVTAPGQPVKLSWIVSPGGGTPTLSMDNGVTISNPTNYFSYETVNPSVTTTYTLTATDGATSVTKAVTVVVSSFPPVAQEDAATAGYQSPVAFSLLATDPDSPASTLTYAVVSAPANGTLSGTAPNLTYTPNAGFSGADSFTWKANDGNADSNAATFNITVNPAPAPITAVDLSGSIIRTDDGLGSFIGLLQAGDANADDAWTFSLVAGAGDTHNSYFSVVGNQLISNHDFTGDVGQTVSLRVRATDSTGNSFETVITRGVAAADLHVKINEIYYNSPRNNVPCEFIELYNPFGTAVDVSGWRFTRGVDYAIPSGTSIPANGYLVIAQNPSVIASLYPGTTALGPWTGGLSSDGDTIELRDAANIQVDEVSYGINFPWPTPPNGDGPSLELMNPALDNDLGGHWRASTPQATVSDYVSAGTSWRFRPGTNEASSPVTAWRDLAFVEDATWKSGNAPIGLFKINNNTAVAAHPESGTTLNTQLTAATTGLATDMATYAAASTDVLTNFTVAYRSVFFRKTFNVSGTIPKALYLRVMHNDAAIVWINGVEVARFGFDPANATGEIAVSSQSEYERGNDPWSDKAILNADSILIPGSNIITIQGWTKPPVLRGGPNAQDAAANYNIFDFAVDAVLRPLTENSGTPGAANSVLTANPPPAVRQVEHSPNEPRSNQTVLITAKVSDRQGLGSVQLAYQIVAPGSYLSSIQTVGFDAMGINILGDRNMENQPNPAFEAAANWTLLPMVDDGSVTGDVAGDGVFSARIPAQPHRTLVRYRILAADLLGAQVRVPLVDDSAKNFAYFVYDGVPAYQTPSGTFGPTSLLSLPVYHFVIHPADFEAMNAYTVNFQVSLGNLQDLYALLARRVYNFEGAMVYDGKVYDHVEVRLRGGNSRYNGTGKRHYRFKFPKGYAFKAKDNKGRPYPRDWEDMLFNKLFGNKGAYDFGLPYAVGAKMWQNLGVPMPFNHWVHFRVVRNAAEADASLGDFYGLFQALELPDGKNFLKARDLPPGNFYKMSDWIQNGEMDERYQAAGSVDYAEDFDNIRYNAHPQASQSWLETNIDMPNWYSYRVIQEAIRHYDIFIEPTGRHRCKNLYWYFRPSVNPNGFGQLVQMPYDWDASFGPNWNNGNEFVSNALGIVNSAIGTPASFIDSPTWVTGGALPSRTAMRIQLRNRIREAQDLMIYRDGTGRGPCDDIIDDALAIINPFYQVDMARWPSNTGAAGHFAGGAPAKALDMKNFLFVSWTDQFGADPAVPAGGRAAFLTSISDGVAYNVTTLDGDVGQIPAKPTITYTGVAGYPLDGLSFASSAFSDPQGAGDFGAYEWRIGEVTDPSAPAYDPAADRVYEVVDVWRSAEVSTVATNTMQIPASVLRTGHAYRARVRHKDATGRYGHWSDPVQFTAAAPDAVAILGANLVVSELMYKPADATTAEGLNGWTTSDFEFIELQNISTTLTLDLTDVRFTKGVDFDFNNGSIHSLAPGQRLVVVRNLAAFQSRYGTGAAVAGLWDAGQNLANGGEEVKLSYGLGAAIRQFTYDDATPWPTNADDGGVSLVLISPNSNPDHAAAASWRGSYNVGGNPGGPDVGYEYWSQVTGASLSGSGDSDQDGLSDLIEYLLGTSPASSSTEKVPTASVQTIDGTDYLTMTFVQAPHTDGLQIFAETSTDLSVWNTDAVLVSETTDGDGRITRVFRGPVPFDIDVRRQMRVRVVKP